MMMRAPNCCAVRASFTRDEIRIAAWSETSADAGATSATSRNVRVLAIALPTPGAAKIAIPPR